jgi:hypothetical protein
MMYAFYVLMIGVFVLFGWLAPSVLGHSREAVDVSYPDCASLFPVRLSLDGLTRSNSRIDVSVAAVRADLLDGNPVVMRYDRTVDFVSAGQRRDSPAGRHAKIALPFADASSRGDVSAPHVISSEALPAGCESIEYNFTFLFDRPDITRLHFLFSYPDTAVYSYRRAIRSSIAAGFVVALLCVSATRWDSENPVQLFYCLMLGVVGLLALMPLQTVFGSSAAYGAFELLVDQMYITVYRIFVVIQVTSIARRSATLPPLWLVAIAAFASLYGMGEAACLAENTELDQEQQSNRIPLGDLRRVPVFILYAIAVFAVLVHSLCKMAARHWKRGGLLALLLVAPMLVEVITEVHLPIFGIRKAALRNITRTACYGVGGILFILAFNPFLEPKHLQACQ